MVHALAAGPPAHRHLPRRAARAAGRLSHVPALVPGLWFNGVSTEEYARRYYGEILKPLDRQKVIADLLEMAAGKVPVLVCFERAGGSRWCHRALASAWLAEGLGQVVPEFGYEELPREKHPLLPAQPGKR